MSSIKPASYCRFLLVAMIWSKDSLLCCSKAKYKCSMFKKNAGSLFVLQVFWKSSKISCHVFPVENWILSIENWELYQLSTRNARFLSSVEMTTCDKEASNYKPQVASLKLQYWTFNFSLFTYHFSLITFRLSSWIIMEKIILVLFFIYPSFILPCEQGRG